MQFQIYLAIGFVSVGFAQIDSNPCLSLPKTGPCRAYFQRYHYNPLTNSCEGKFIYGGCQGNGNNFETTTDCLAKCFNTPLPTGWYQSTLGTRWLGYIGVTDNMPQPVPKPEPVERLQPIESGQPPRWIQPGESGQPAANGQPAGWIQPGESGQPVESGNPGESVQPQLQRPPECELLPDGGICLAYFERYFYNASSNSCSKRFIYGGCGGNGNNFETEDQCKQKCMSTAAQPKVLPNAYLSFFQMLPGNCPGGFILDEIKNATHEECAASCVKTSGCTGFSYVDFSQWHDSKFCLTKHSSCDFHNLINADEAVRYWKLIQ